jgi:hypothetical protein
MTIAAGSLTVGTGETVTLDLTTLISGGLAPFTFTLLGQPIHGSASIDAHGVLTVTADAGASGSETIGFLVTDSYGNAAVTSAATAEGTITLVYPAAPTATATATPPVGPTATATEKGPLPPNPNAGNGGNGDGTGGNGSGGNEGGGTGSGNGVTQLPSTGNGSEADGHGSLAIMLYVLMAALVLGVAGAKVLRIRMQ